MRVDATRPIMRHSIGTPDRLVLLQVEIVVPIEQMDHFYLDLGLRVGECAELLVVALEVLVGVGLAELGLVPAGVVHLLDLVVRVVAQLVGALGLAAHLVAVELELGAAPIGLVVVVYAGLPLVVV